MLKVLRRNTFEYCLYELITKRIDLSVFDTLYKDQVSFLLEALDNTNYLDLMKNKIDSDQGKRDYAKRMWTVEPVFVNITSNKGMNKLTPRGKEKVTCQ